MIGFVCWWEIMVNLGEIGVMDYWEVGLGKVLIGLCK